MKKQILILMSTILWSELAAQTESINYKLKTEETFRVTTDKKKHYTYFSAHAPVTMADGAVKDIADIRVGEHVKSFTNGKNSVTRVKQVDIYNYPGSALTALYLRPTQETTASNSTERHIEALLLETTPYHHVLTQRGRKKVKNLSKKDVLYHFEPATGEVTTWKIGAIQENARRVVKAYNLKTVEGTYLVENVVVN